MQQPSWWRTWWAPVLQLVTLSALTVTSAAVIDHRTAQLAADLAAERGTGRHVALAPRHPKAAAPVAVEVPALHTRSTLIDLHRLPDGTLQVPKDAAQAGWYVGSSHPGDPGPTVIAGHVDSRTGPGVFFHLDRLKKGDVIVVRRADRTALRFVISNVMRVPKRAFPTALVYVGTRSPSLRLVSCGGDFDRASGHYLDNIIVLASPLKARPPAKAAVEAPRKVPSTPRASAPVQPAAKPQG